MHYQKISNEDLKELVLGMGAVDVGIIPLTSLPNDQQENAKHIMPSVKSIISIAVDYNQSAIKSKFQPIGNMAFKNGYKQRDKVCYGVEKELLKHTNNVVCVTDTFAMDYELETPWLLSHKDIAEKAGIGVMGLNRIVLHPLHGVGITLGAILIDQDFDKYDQPLKDDPCINCNLCKAVCPTGCINKDDFNFMSCYTHNYRNRGNSFGDLVTRLEHKNTKLDPITYDEKNKLWASIQEGYGFSCNRCIAVCPASQKELAQFKTDKKKYYQTYVKPFLDKEEVVFMTEGSNVEAYIDKNPNKTKKIVSNGMTMDSILAFKNGLRIVFNKSDAMGLNRTFQFEFTGKEKQVFTVRILDGAFEVVHKQVEGADLIIKADSQMWLKAMKEKKYFLIGMVSGKIKLKGNPKNMSLFSKIFRS